MVLSSVEQLDTDKSKQNSGVTVSLDKGHSEESPWISVIMAVIRVHNTSCLSLNMNAVAHSM
jgi:hypothetical protein